MGNSPADGSAAARGRVARPDPPWATPYFHSRRGRTGTRVARNKRHFLHRNRAVRRPLPDRVIPLCAYGVAGPGPCLQHGGAGQVGDLTSRPDRSSRNDKRRAAHEAIARRGRCKWCGSNRVVRNGHAKGQQLWRCRECRHQFFDNGTLRQMRAPERPTGG